MCSYSFPKRRLTMTKFGVVFCSTLFSVLLFAQVSPALNLTIQSDGNRYDNLGNDSGIAFPGEHDILQYGSGTVGSYNTLTPANLSVGLNLNIQIQTVDFITGLNSYSNDTYGYHTQFNLDFNGNTIPISVPIFINIGNVDTIYLNTLSDKYGGSPAGEGATNLGVNPALYNFVLPEGTLSVHLLQTLITDYSPDGSGVLGVPLYADIDYTPTATPEPSALLLFGAGLGGLALLRRKGRNQSV
jgi:hypothetical protein